MYQAIVAISSSMLFWLVGSSSRHFIYDLTSNNYYFLNKKYRRGVVGRTLSSYPAQRPGFYPECMFCPVLSPATVLTLC